MNKLLREDVTVDDLVEVFSWLQPKEMAEFFNGIAKEDWFHGNDPKAICQTIALNTNGRKLLKNLGKAANKNFVNDPLK